MEIHLFRVSAEQLFALMMVVDSQIVLVVDQIDEYAVYASVHLSTIYPCTIIQVRPYLVVLVYPSSSSRNVKYRLRLDPRKHISWICR